jgi:hypothetical protein
MTIHAAPPIITDRSPGQLSKAARTAAEFERLLTAVHRHNKSKLITERCMHDLIVATMQENWAIIETHLARMASARGHAVRRNAHGPSTPALQSR